MSLSTSGDANSTGQPEANRCALTLNTLRADISALCIDKRACDSKSQPCAAVSAIPRSVHAVEALEDER